MKNIEQEVESQWGKAKQVILDLDIKKSTLAKITGLSPTSITLKIKEVDYNKFTHEQKLKIINHLHGIKKKLNFLN